MSHPPQRRPRVDRPVISIMNHLAPPSPLAPMTPVTPVTPHSSDTSPSATNSHPISPPAAPSTPIEPLSASTHQRRGAGVMQLMQRRHSDAVNTSANYSTDDRQEDLQLPDVSALTATALPSAAFVPLNTISSTHHLTIQVKRHNASLQVDSQVPARFSYLDDHSKLQPQQQNSLLFGEYPGGGGISPLTPGELSIGISRQHRPKARKYQARAANAGSRGFASSGGAGYVRKISDGVRQSAICMRISKCFVRRSSNLSSISPAASPRAATSSKKRSPFQYFSSRLTLRSVLILAILGTLCVSYYLLISLPSSPSSSSTSTSSRSSLTNFLHSMYSSSHSSASLPSRASSPSSSSHPKQAGTSIISSRLLSEAEVLRAAGLPNILDDIDQTEQAVEYPNNTLLLATTSSVLFSEKPFLCSTTDVNSRPVCSWDHLHSNPAELFTYQSGLRLLQSSNGLVVRIFYKDTCCRVTSNPASIPPLAYFRVILTGTLQTTSHPLLSIGGSPPHTRTHVARVSGWKVPPLVFPMSEDWRGTQTLIPIGEQGSVQVRVELLAWDVGREMTQRLYEDDRESESVVVVGGGEGNGKWLGKMEKTTVAAAIAAPLKQQSLITTSSTTSLLPTTHSTHYIPLSSSLYSSSTDPFLRPQLPWCGSASHSWNTMQSYNEAEDLGHVTGRWKWERKSDADYRSDPTALNSYETIKNSSWIPHFCRMHSVTTPQDNVGGRTTEEQSSAPQAIDKLTSFDTLRMHKWTHFVGDDRVQAVFRTMCAEKEDGKHKKTKLFTSPTAELCYGFSSSTDSKANDNPPPWSSILFVLTYESWSIGNMLQGDPMPFREYEKETKKSFWFSEACTASSNTSSLFNAKHPAWPKECLQAPRFLQDLSGPSVTFFGLGRRHISRFGGDSGTNIHITSLNGDSRQPEVIRKDTTRAFLLPIFSHAYFTTYPTLFLLSTPFNERRLIPPYYRGDGSELGRVNNIRIYELNRVVVDMVRRRSVGIGSNSNNKVKPYASRHLPSTQQWLPIIDLFTPAYSALSSLIPLPTSEVVHSPFDWEASERYRDVVKQLVSHYLVRCENVKVEMSDDSSKQEAKKVNPASPSKEATPPGATSSSKSSPAAAAPSTPPPPATSTESDKKSEKKISHQEWRDMLEKQHEEERRKKREAEEKKE